MEKNQFFVFVFFWCMYITNSAQVSEEKGLDGFEKINDSISYLDALNKQENDIIDPETTFTIQDLDEIIALGKRLSTNIGLGKAYQVKAGFCRIKNNDLLEGLKNYKYSLQYYKKAKDTSGLKLVYNRISGTEYYRGNRNKCIDYLLEYRKLIAPTDSLMLVKFYNNLGLIYIDVKNNRAAETALLKSIEYGNNSVKHLGNTFNILGDLYMSEGKYDKVKPLVKPLISKKNKSLGSKEIAYFLLARLSRKQKQFETAKKYVDSGLAIAKPNKHFYNTQTGNTILAGIQIDLGKQKEAENLLNESDKFFQEADAKSDILTVYNTRVSLDSSRGDIKGALTWLKKYQELQNKILSDNSVRSLKNIEEDYQGELENLQIIQQQEMDAQKSKGQIFRLRVYTVLFAVGLLSGLCFVFVLVKSRKTRRNLIVKLRESNQIKNKLFSIISHDLKNEIFALDTSLGMMKNGQMTTEEFQKVLPLMVQRTNQTSILLNNLLNWSKSQMNELSANPTHFNLSELVSSKFNFFRPKATEKEITLNNQLDNVQVYADQNMVGIITQNLIANAVKFCDSGDIISLSSTDKGDSMDIYFSDTGVGIAPENLSKLFAEETFSTNGTQNESGTGLGLRICKELVELNNGAIRVESTIGEGTTFIIQLPKT